MRIQEEKNISIKKTIIKKIICNCCGKEYDVINECDFSDITPISITFGYGSKFDTDTLEFELCDDCIEKIVSTFKYEPDKISMFD